MRRQTRFTIYRQKKVVKPLYKLCIVLFLLVIAFLLVKPVCVSLAAFLSMPKSETHCDAILVEGGSVFSEYIVEQALEAYYAGQAKAILFVMYSSELSSAIFGIHDYRALVLSAIDSLNIPAADYKLLMLDIQDPYTYNAARVLADTLTDIQSLLILSDNFHIRRSFLTFNKVFKAKNIAVYPYTYDIYLTPTNWWRSANGWRRVLNEYIKLIFYWIKGYI